MQLVPFIIYFLNGAALESHGREFLHVKEIGTAQMIVPHGYAGVYTCCFYIEKYSRLFNIVHVADDTTVKLLKSSIHKRDSAVLHLEINRCMCRVYLVVRLSH